MKTSIASLAGFGVLSVAGSILYWQQQTLDCSGGGRLCEGAGYSEYEMEAEAENPLEKMQRFDARAGEANFPPPGAKLKAYEQTQALEAQKSLVRGTGGRWQQYGVGPLIASGLAQTLGAAPLPDTNLLKYAGRVDELAYDPAAKRLFAAPGSGGIWMSEARDGDVRTLGDYWISIGDNLPTQTNGGVIWTPAGGGTIVSAGGDSTMSTGAFAGLGAFWSNDLGLTWTRSEGFPDDVLVFNTATDPGNPNILYIASSVGLYRSEDAGRSFRNVALPTTPECAGNIDRSTACALANVVSDVVVKAPGGVTDFVCRNTGCPVLAAVGWRAGSQFYPDGVTPKSPANGLYRSSTGQAGSFERLDLSTVDPLTGMGFAEQERIGRIEMGVASGPLQDHDYVYAIVQDAKLLQGESYPLDPPLSLILPESPVGGLSNGLYVSTDFGSSWIRMADNFELSTVPGPYTALIQPGAQAWFNMWVRPDPTRAVPGLGIPTRMVYGFEELFQNLVDQPLNGLLQAQVPQDFQNISYYFSATGADLTVHPDQHDGVWVPTGDGGVCLFVGHDGGVNRQCALPGAPLNQQGWGMGANDGFYTLLPYGHAVAKDGTVWFGLQDNGSGHIEPDTGFSFMDFGADGFYAEVDPDNSDIAYTETQNGGLRRTTDRGASATFIDPPYARVNFANWFSMDPLDSNHMITLANQVFETLDAPNVTSGTWNEVYRLGVNPRTEVLFTARFGDVHGDAIYVGACGDCGVTTNDTGFQNKIATNVGGRQPPQAGTPNGWHDATAAGLPNRFIGAVEINHDDPFTVYIGLHGYDSEMRGPGVFGDQNPEDPQVDAGNIFMSTDAGESFVSIQGNLPKVPVNYILQRDQQLLVATDFGVFISSDLQGSNWAPLGEGLPKAPVSQVKLQPGNPNKLFASLYGRHIWTYEFPADARMLRDPLEEARQANRLARSAKGGALGFAGLALLALFGLRRRARR